MKYSTDTIGRLYMLIAMILSGSIGYFALESQQVSANIVFVRCIIGALFLFGYVWIFKLYPDRADITFKTLLMLLVGGLTLVFNWLFLFESYKTLSIGITTVIYSTQPFILMILGAFLLKEKIKLESLILIVIAFIGLVIVVLGGDIQQSEVKVSGVINALVAATLYAISTIYTKKITKLKPTFIAMCHLCIGCVVFINFVDVDNFIANIPTGHNLIILGLVHTGFMYIFLYGAYEKSDISSLAIMSFVYPIVALSLDVIIYDLKLTHIEISGVIVILLSLITYNSINYIKGNMKNA